MNLALRTALPYLALATFLIFRREFGFLISGRSFLILWIFKAASALGHCC